ncbi:ATPase inhibitor subunit zeta [Palleronia abyssalis]|uniref:DUF1476 domain-containing protein n=1 Tax=Palleronia abyssalis TaxID=1501240 RepID=A0A2R8BU98_9RHOB|nr:ATPase inhibitor subunit zeta [Palleronia abyssalis]SPJ23705.1 hypothetical protein PAA8504_01520 [Palleronia abyssalis]
MHIFDDRERAFEHKWARDAEHRLRIRARRNRLLADWAVAEGDLTGNAAADRARALMKKDYEPGGEHAFFSAIAEETGRDTAEIRGKAEEFATQADSEVIV